MTDLSSIVRPCSCRNLNIGSREENVRISFIQNVAGVLVAMVIGALATTQAHADAKLVSSSPAQGASVDSPATIELHFSDAVDQKQTNIDLRDVDGTSVTVTPAASSDPKIYTANLAGGLPSGTYNVAWTAVDS